jgi:HAE1 family hydrophobic/amphiphilic exporter-1
VASDIPFDVSKFVQQSIHEIYDTIYEVAVLVLIVILVFLQSWRAMLVPATALPVTILAAFAAIAAFGFTLNVSSMFAIVLAIGVVVDDAIVVVEAAVRNIDKGMSGREAASQAMRELFGPIVGITLVLMAVFLPAAFLPGLIGRIYAQFALVIAATALISALNALTLKPTQSAMWLRPELHSQRKNIFSRIFNTAYMRLEYRYSRLIGSMVKRSVLMAIVACAVIGISAYGLWLLAPAYCIHTGRGPGVHDCNSTVAGKSIACADTQGLGTGDGDQS